MGTIILIFAGALVIAAGTMPVVKRMGHRIGIIDQPGEHKIHLNPMPRIGGIAMYSAVLLALVVLRNRYNFDEAIGILISATWMSLVGVIDDRSTLRPLVKLAGQLTGAFFLLWAGIQVNLFREPFLWLNWLITIGWIVGITNAMNLLDNMDGLSGGVAAIAAIFFTLLAIRSGQYLVGILSAAVAGAAIGFWLYNFNPARVFMGDSGSLFLGLMLAAVGIKLRFPASSPIITWLVPVLVLGVPVFDTVYVTFSRIRRHLHPFTAGTDHTSHRLVRMGFTRREAVMALYLVAGMLGMLAQFVTEASLVEAYLIAAAVVVLAVVAFWRLDQVSPNSPLA
jgi:UDP-GlcNAc:undecaprenyl-phosphate/decaprenyl-phosphate GlcNAc-1-phosphate transferase